MFDKCLGSFAKSRHSETSRYLAIQRPTTKWAQAQQYLSMYRDISRDLVDHFEFSRLFGEIILRHNKTLENMINLAAISPIT